jgi:hypothetical protein
VSWSGDYPDPAYYAEMEREREALLRSEMYDDPHAGLAADRFEGPTTCRLPYEQRMSEATRVGRCRMLGIDPYPDQSEGVPARKAPGFPARRAA